MAVLNSQYLEHLSVVSETSGLPGNSAEITSAAVTGVTLGKQGSSAQVPP